MLIPVTVPTVWGVTTSHCDDYIPCSVKILVESYKLFQLDQLVLLSHIWETKSVHIAFQHLPKCFKLFLLRSSRTMKIKWSVYQQADHRHAAVHTSTHPHHLRLVFISAGLV